MRRISFVLGVRRTAELELGGNEQTLSLDPLSLRLISILCPSTLMFNGNLVNIYEWLIFHIGINDMTLLVENPCLIDVMKFDNSKSNFYDEVDGAFCCTMSELDKGQLFCFS